MNLTHSPAGLALSLVGDVRSLGLVSQSDEALKKFSKRLLACVRSMDDAVVVDEYSGHEFLNLISRLNQEVAPYLRQQAQPSSPSGPIHIWVIEQADKLSTEQQSIIFRLIELFPALPFRVIWLSSQPLQAWKEHAKTECVFLDLDAIDPGSAREDAPKDTPDPVDASVPDPVDAADAAPRTEWGWRGRVPRNARPIVAAVLATGLIAVWAWRSAVPPDAVPAPATPAAATAETDGTATPQANTATDAGAATAPQAVASEFPGEASAKSPSPANTAPPEVARTGARWLKNLPADTLVVEHGLFPTLEQAQKFQAKHKALSTARILAVRKAADGDDWQYSVVTGPFRSEDRARTYVSRLDWRAGTRIRATDKLKALLVPSP